MQEVSTKVAGNVRAEVSRKGDVTQRAIADTLGLSQQAVSRRLKGKTPFSIDEVSRVAQLLEVPMDRLLRDPDEAVA